MISRPIGLKTVIPALLGMSLLSFLFIGCLPQQGPSPREEMAGPTPEPLASPTGELEHIAIFYVPHLDGNPQDLLKLLRQTPRLHATLIFPAHYFDLPTRRELIPLFRVLQSSGQIEMALTLENEPMLPLLGNFQQAFQGMPGWNVNFSWPEDIAGQIARGSGQYQKRWTRLPSGFYPPYLSLNDQVVKTLQRFRLSYVLSKPSVDWGVKNIGSTMMLIPPAVPISAEMEGSLAWADGLADIVLKNPFSMIDAAWWKNPESEMAFLNSLAKKLDQKPFTFETHRGEELDAYVMENHLLTVKKDSVSNDYSLWVKTPQQKVAWQALSEARKVLETYKNSGRAVLSRLDAATEEMYNAESGAFLLSLGQTQVPLPLNERTFIATLANVYRLSGTPVPENLNRLFAYRKYQMTSEKTGPLPSDEPFFESGDKTLRWNDPAGDDFGGGTFRYPAGNYPSGCFDLKKFSIRWTDDFVTFSAAVAGPLPSEKIQPLLPMVDVYIDVNRLVGAGRQEALQQRGAVSIDREAAWEYAVAFDQTSAVLYQSLPGKEPRKLGTFKSSPTPTSKSFSVSVPLDLLRGLPTEWRIAVAMGGVEQTNQSSDPTPIPVLAQPGPKNFGGAIGGRSAPRYIDILMSSTDEQKTLMKGYESGRKVILPTVEAP